MAIQEIISARNNGLQVRVGQGTGQTRFLSYRKYGGITATRHLAEKVERELESIWGKRPGCVVGRKMRNNKSGIPGLRFQWREYSDRYVYLYLAGNYRNTNGRICAFAYSVEKHGFDEVLRRGLEIRIKHGAPAMSFEDAKAAILEHYIDVATS